MSALGLLSEGWLEPKPVQNRALCLLSLAWLCTLQQIQPQPQPPTPQPPQHVIGGGGGGVAPFLFPTNPALPGPVPEPPSPEAIDRRAETLAASMGAAIQEGDEATRLAATLALLLCRPSKS